MKSAQHITPVAQQNQIATLKSKELYQMTNYKQNLLQSSKQLNLSGKKKSNDNSYLITTKKNRVVAPKPSNSQTKSGVLQGRINASFQFPKINMVRKTSQFLSNNKSVNRPPLKPTYQSTFTPADDQSEMRCDSPLLPLESLPLIVPSKISSRAVGSVNAYGANTHEGLVRNYNEDRVSIILNMNKPTSKPNDMNWPQCSFFAVYDGHGGSLCAEFLKDNLHNYIIRDEFFPQNPKMAIKRGFEQAEQAFVQLADSGRTIEKSGSCAVCALIIDSTCYVANVGDSRAIISQDQGQKAVQLTEDHKPNLPSEEQRIISHGGQIYQSQIPVQTAVNKIEYITGPFRVLPGRLAVSRTMGDSEAKLPKYNGIPNVISAEPDIFSFKIGEEQDFLLLGCDGIFDKMSTKDVINTVWGTSINKDTKNIHDFTGRAIENVMRQCLQRKSYDNVTVVFIAFSSLEKFINYKKQN